jgi:hypothetical protein
MSDGMFLTACREVAKEFPNIAYDEDLLDRACLQVCTSLAVFLRVDGWVKSSRLCRIPNRMQTE